VYQYVLGFLLFFYLKCVVLKGTR